MNTQKKERSLGRTSTKLACSLMLGASIASMFGGAALAQGDTGPIETVVVTGSLIPRADMGDTAVPTVIVSATDIKKTGYANIANVLEQVPQIQATSASDLTPTNSNFLTSGFGVSNIDLRQLGASRTLVLVNGRRWVTGSPTGTSVDINTIPTQLVSRVDVVTGGNSAIYGSDAVAGVINIILKDDYEGLTATAQYGKSSRNDGGDTYLSVLVGGNFMDGKGNITLDMSYEDSLAVPSGNRDLTQTDAGHYPGLFGCYGTSGCFWLGGGTFSSYPPPGRFRWAAPIGAGGQVISDSISYNPNGTFFSDAANGFDRNPHRYIQVPLIRRILSETGHLQITPWLRFFFEGTYASTTGNQRLEPYPGSSEDGVGKPLSAGGTGILIPKDNPFIPAALQATYTQPANPFSFVDPVSTPADLNSPGLFFYRRFIDFGNRTGHVSRDMARAAFGFKGTYGGLTKTLPFLDDWTWEASYVWGRTTESQTNGGYYDKIKLQQALDTSVATPAQIAAGVPYATVGGTKYVCSSTIAQSAGCVPVDLFGAYAITGPAAAYVQSLVTLQDEAVEQDVSFHTTGSLFSLPAGDVQMAIGAEYRSESANFVPDAASQAGTVAGNQVPATHGNYQTHEVFGELSIPILKDLPMAQMVSFDASGRYSYYSTAGGSTTWNLQGTWQPIDDLKIRANESSATRAPNISELFSPNAQTFPGISTDICAAPPTPTAAANCATQIAAQAPGAITTPSYGGQIGLAARQGVGGYVSGNPNLSPETAHTFTAGFVYTPSWISRLQLTMDYYDIRVHGYIGSLGTYQTQAACYLSTLPVASNPFCQQITRGYDSTLGPIIKQINFPSFNLGSIRTAGVDASLSYGFDMGDISDSLANAGGFNFALDATYVGYFNTDPGLPGTSIIRSGGDAGLEKWRGTLKTTYTNGPLSTMLTLRYIGPSYVSRESVSTKVSANRIPSVWYTDINVSYDLTDKLQIYAGAHNLFDVQPPETYIGAFDDVGTGTLTTSYDAIGLYAYGGVTVKM